MDLTPQLDFADCLPELEVHPTDRFLIDAVLDPCPRRAFPIVGSGMSRPASVIAFRNAAIVGTRILSAAATSARVAGRRFRERERQSGAANPRPRISGGDPRRVCGSLRRGSRCSRRIAGPCRHAVLGRRFPCRPLPSDSREHARASLDTFHSRPRPLTAAASPRRAPSRPPLPSRLDESR